MYFLFKHQEYLFVFISLFTSLDTETRQEYTNADKRRSRVPCVKSHTPHPLPARRARAHTNTHTSHLLGSVQWVWSVSSSEKAEQSEDVGRSGSCCPVRSRLPSTCDYCPSSLHPHMDRPRCRCVCVCVHLPVHKLWCKLHQRHFDPSGSCALI